MPGENGMFVYNDDSLELIKRRAFLKLPIEERRKAMRLKLKLKRKNRRGNPNAV